MSLLKEGCPGSQEIRNPFPDEIKCAFCGADNEIWSDEVDTRCKSCGKTIDRQMKETCLQWCPAAKECVGSTKYERIMNALKSQDEDAK